MGDSSQFQCRWALLGLSNIATLFVQDLLLQRDEGDAIAHQIACVSTTGTAERAQRWLKDRKIPSAQDVTVFHSAEEMLKKGSFDVVYISTPHPLHYQEALVALRNGRNVLVEKPATMNKPQFQKLAEEAKKSGSVLMEAMWTRYLPAVLHLQNEVLPKLGQVKRVFSDLSVPIASEAIPLSSRLFDKKAGAGALLDMGVYALTWADIAFGGSAKPVVAYANTVPYNTGAEPIDDINTVVLTNPDNGGSVAIVTTSLSLAGSKKTPDKLAVEKAAPSVRIEGTNGQVSVPFPLIRPQELRVEWYDDERLGPSGSETKEIISKPVERGWGLWYQADVIAKAVRDREQGLVIGEDENLRVLGWMDTARQMANIMYDKESESL